ncbi:hypothetical protein [Campylobacter sp. RM16192]|uniref:hypothetical protein n=1 Tax=Campylobacter sp. RM16192 TaxID=1660080 RepID=UPI001452068F|nr:hypothetical protein [Campylobacter sp. RM16192]QCD52583.1 putative lipid asymmetry ABC transporter MlaABCDEF component MlaB [Campylobacter sp. RM16192]
MRNLAIFVFSIFIAGCSIIAKPAPSIEYLMLGNNSFSKCEGKNKILVFVEQTKAINMFDSRSIIKINDKGQVDTIKGVKWITTPSDMIYKNFLAAINSSCELDANFDRRNLVLKTNLITLQTDEKEATIGLGFTILKDEKILKSSIMTSKKAIAENTPQNALIALNLAMNDIVTKILDEIKGSI